MKTSIGILAALVLCVGVVAVAHSKTPHSRPAAVTASTSVPSVYPMISTNEGGCWDKCKTCESKCGQDNACKNKCWDTNDTCCAGVGGKGVYKMCGCKDK
jgi:hypothetical protein